MARLLNILIISSEVINVGEDAERRGSVLLVGERDDARLTFLFDPALGRRFALEFSDDSRLRVHQRLLHTSARHLSPILLHFLLGKGYHLPWLDKALALLNLDSFMSHNFL